MNYTELNDSELTIRCKEELPDKYDAYNHLVERYKNYVFKIAYEKLSNREDAEEVTQETFVRIFFGLKNFRMESSLKTWITRITINICLTIQLSNKYKFWRYCVTPEGDVDLENIYSSILNKQQEENFWKKLGALLKKMIDQYRKVFIFRYIKNLTITQISQKISSSIGATKMRIKRAKDQFYKILNRD
ncbi:MAG: RNA polymerase sigma factor [Ignavibacteria bacterium]|nr:RNA polymerase sigma factor [Ignavibacteria bacterium]